MRELQEDEEEGEGKVTEQGLQGKKSQGYKVQGPAERGMGQLEKKVCGLRETARARA